MGNRNFTDILYMSMGETFTTQEAHDYLIGKYRDAGSMMTVARQLTLDPRFIVLHGKKYVQGVYQTTWKKVR